jgi:CRP/FNR family transcriptional regulator
MTATATLQQYEPLTRRAIPLLAEKTGNVSRLATHCSSCGLKDLCLPCGLRAAEIDMFEDLIYTRRRLKRGETLYRTGDKFDSIYAVRSGFYKTVMMLDDGREQVTGFHMAGELLGMDGIAPEIHSCDAVALEDSEVCVIPYARLANLGDDNQALQRQFHKAMSREIVREHGVMMLLGTMRAEERIAIFLLTLSQRFAARGYSPSQFILRMTREEIGSYLGLKFETVSRMFSRFQEEGVISVQQKHIHILDLDVLQESASRKPD